MKLHYMVIPSMLKSVNTVNDDTEFHFKTLFSYVAKDNYGKRKLLTKMKSASDAMTYIQINLDKYLFRDALILYSIF